MLAVNSYFDDKVKSIAFKGDTLPTTVGVISPGEYAFDTSKNEVMTVLSGTLTVQLPNSEDWIDYSSGQSFAIAANQVFHVKTVSDTAYLCTYE